AGNRFSGEIHDGVGPVNPRGPRSALAVRRPVGPFTSGQALRTPAAREDDDSVTFGGAGVRERRSEKARAAGNDDAHDSLHFSADASPSNTAGDANIPLLRPSSRERRHVWR